MRLPPPAPEHREILYFISCEALLDSPYPPEWWHDRGITGIVAASAYYWTWLFPRADFGSPQPGDFTRAYRKLQAKVGSVPIIPSWNATNRVGNPADDRYTLCFGLGEDAWAEMFRRQALTSRELRECGVDRLLIDAEINAKAGGSFGTQDPNYSWPDLPGAKQYGERWAAAWRAQHPELRLGMHFLYPMMRQRPAFVPFCRGAFGTGESLLLDCSTFYVPVDHCPWRMGQIKQELKLKKSDVQWGAGFMWHRMVSPEPRDWLPIWARLLRDTGRLLLFWDGRIPGTSRYETHNDWFRFRPEQQDVIRDMLHELRTGDLDALARPRVVQPGRERRR